MSGLIPDLGNLIGSYSGPSYETLAEYDQKTFPIGTEKVKQCTGLPLDYLIYLNQGYKLALEFIKNPPESSYNLDRANPNVVANIITLYLMKIYMIRDQKLVRYEEPKYDPKQELSLYFTTGAMSELRDIVYDVEHEIQSASESYPNSELIITYADEKYQKYWNSLNIESMVRIVAKYVEEIEDEPGYTLNRFWEYLYHRIFKNLDRVAKETGVSYYDTDHFEIQQDLYTKVLDMILAEIFEGV